MIVLSWTLKQNFLTTPRRSYKSNSPKKKKKKIGIAAILKEINPENKTILIGLQ